MRTTNRTGIVLRAALLLTVLGTLAAQQTAQAGAIKDFTGYTRIGWPPANWPKGDPRYVEALKSTKAVGATIYFMVLDQKTGEIKSKTGDVWGTGVSNFDSTFVAGRDTDRSKLDTEARYLYLYQVVNDSGKESAIREISIRLVIDPALITSWGHFVERKTVEGKTAIRGVGFTMPFVNRGAKGDPTIRPVSTSYPGVVDRRYFSPAPAVTSPRIFGLGPITLGEDVPVAAGQDVGREPDTILITPGTLSGSALKDSVSLRTAMLSDLEGVSGLEDAKARDAARLRWRSRWPYFRAVFNANTVKPNQRSTVFGFTSNAPPTLEEVTLGSKAMGIGVARRAVEGEIAGAAAIDDRSDKIERRYPGDKTLPDGDTRVIGAGFGDGPGTGPGGLTTPGTGTGPGTGGAPGTGGGPGAVGIAPATGVGPSGSLPTPFVRPAATAPTGGGAPTGGAAAGGAGGGLGAAPIGLGGSLGGGFGGGASTPGGGGGAYFPPRSSGGGGFGGGGSGSGNNSGNSGTDQGQGSGQNQNQGVPITNTVNVNVTQTNTQTQTQTQQQQQQQQQQQGQNQNQTPGPNGNVVPLPPAWLLGLLGLPAFLFLGRRKPTNPEEAVAPPDEPAT